MTEKIAAAPATTKTLIPGNKALGSSGIEVRIQDFIAIEILGQGAGGMVKKAIHKPTKKIIALKEIPFQSDEKMRKQILIELKMFGMFYLISVLRVHNQRIERFWKNFKRKVHYHLTNFAILSTKKRARTSQLAKSLS